jgi:NTE family protein
LESLSSDLKVGLALGGGAARGLAHVGVLRVLIENDVPIHAIVGTSIGAMVGGLYATSRDIDEIEGRLVSFLGSPTFRANRFHFFRELRGEADGLIGSFRRALKRGIVIGYTLSRPSFISAQQFERSMTALLDDVAIEEARIPFAAVACDLRRGEEILIREGPLRRAVSASSAIPGVLPPVTWDGRILVDGGWSSKVPVLAAFKMGADVVIGVDISSEIRDTRQLARGWHIFFRASSITESILKRMQCRMADVLIRPKVGDIHWADFGRARECMERGAEATREKLEAIKDLFRMAARGEWPHPNRGISIARFYMGSRLQAPPRE